MLHGTGGSSLCEGQQYPALAILPLQFQGTLEFTPFQRGFIGFSLLLAMRDAGSSREQFSAELQARDGHDG